MNSNMIISLSSIAISLYFFIGSSNFPSGSSDGVPSVSFFPRIVSVVIIILSLVLFISEFKTKRNYFKLSEEKKENVLPFILTIIIIAICLILWLYIPFIPVMFLLLFSLSLVYKQKLLNAVIYSSTLSILIYYIFNKIFNVVLNL